MMVELAVTIPVLLAVVGIAVNLMVFLGDCARFDRVAAEAVRTEAASPGFGAYGTISRAQAVQARIEQSFEGRGWLSFEVDARESAILGGGSGEGGGGDTSSGPSFSLLPHQEEFTCRMRYRPWGFGDRFFGVSFSGIEHSRIFCIDPYRPGVFL
jgi:hypothetical protein